MIVPYDGPLVPELRKAGAEVIVREFPVLRRGIFTPLGVLRFAWQTVSSVVFLTLVARHHKVQVFHTNTASLWAPGLVAAITRKPHVWQVMELVERPRLVRWAMSKMTAVFSTRVFCISDAVRNHFLEDNARYSPKFRTLYHGVDQDEYDPVAAVIRLFASGSGSATNQLWSCMQVVSANGKDRTLWPQPQSSSVTAVWRGASTCTSYSWDPVFPAMSTAKRIWRLSLGNGPSRHGPTCRDTNAISPTG